MNALQQFLQSASNEAAGAVSGPVDLIGMGLRKLGVPVPRNALMSSEWMKQNGLMQDVPQNAASLAGQTFGLLSPVVAAAKAPQIARGLLTMGDNAAAPRRLNPQTGAIAWHGSPHKFDKFDSSKIGTGEGAQAYGHGLYLTESPEVAKQYAGDLAAARASRPIGNVDLATAYQNMPSDVPQSLLAARRDFRALNDMGELSLSDRRDFLEAVRNNIVGAQSGGLYKVDLPDEKIARMLDWDRPLSQQSEAVRAALAKIAPKNRSGQPMLDLDANGGEMLRALGLGDGTSSLLREQGIPGIRYLDGGSRSAGAGSSNFVVFPGEENALKILERNGKPIR